MRPWPWKKNPRTEWELNVAYCRAFGISVLGAAPIALVAGEGTLHLIGTIYTIVWALAAAPVMATLLVLWLDSLLVVAGRQPIFLTRIFVEAELRQHVGERRAVTWLHRVIAISTWLNPLLNATVAFLIVALKVRPRLTAQIFQEVERQTEERRARRHSRIVRDSLTHLSAPVLERIDRQEQHILSGLAAC